ncbi:hypothetical protein [Cumulibacter soli]|uniref:hypothetical protein n=1 Tax=Cumulibacter soli TaxID=2546344 RepID=UPI0010677E2D|nr:hypothetical protein [Cumulibacter soli]
MGIPMFLRPHKVEHRALTGMGGGGPVYGPADTVRVRYERKTGSVVGKDGRTRTYSGLLFWPASPAPGLDDTVTYRGETHTVVAVDELVMIDGTVYHHEVKVT